MPEMMILAVSPLGHRVFFTLSTSFTSPWVMVSWAEMVDCATPFESNKSTSLDGVRATVVRSLVVFCGSFHREMKHERTSCT